MVRIENTERGEWTPIVSPVPFEVQVLSNAIAYPTEPLNLRKLVLRDASLLTHDTTSTGLVVSVDLAGPGGREA